MKLGLKEQQSFILAEYPEEVGGVSSVMLNGGGKSKIKAV